jgi:signal transduction histidine kinase
MPPYGAAALLAAASPLAVFHPGVRSAVEQGIWDAVYLAAFLPFMGAGIALLWGGIRKSASREEAGRLGYILVAMVVGVVTAVSDHVQRLGIPAPRLGPYGTVLAPAVLAAGLLRHGEAYDILAQTRTKLAALNEMAAGLAHEVRNPLAALKGAAGMLGRCLPAEDAACRGHVELITEEIERLDRVLVSFQDFTRPVTVRTEQVSVNEIIGRTLRLLKGHEGGIAIRSQLDDRLPFVKADPALLRQVFLNIIRNAAEACGEGGELSVATASAGGEVTAAFTDDGPGIAPDMRERLFEPFASTKPSGMGVGLAISRRIVEAHGGRLEVEDASPRGARVRVVLPAGRGPRSGNKA